MIDTAVRHPRRYAAAIAAMAATLSLASFVRAQTPAGWTPDWSDDFNGTSLDTSRWNALNRKDSYNNEKQYYRPEQATVSNGSLKLTATNQALDGKAYRSALVQTNVAQLYGRFEITASLPAGQGMWPAIWLLPNAASWPTGGEIDIMENRGSAPTIVGSAYHFGSSVATHQYINKDFSYAVNGTPVSFQNSMHTYAVEWDPSRIRYIIDNVPSFTFYRNSAPISATPMNLILNLAVGGDFGGDPNASTVFPQAMTVDSVKVYDRDTTTSALENQSFEKMSGSLFQNWDEYSNTTNVLVDSVAANAHTGGRAVQMYGRSNGSNNNTSGLFQEVPTTAGEVWQVGAFSQNRPGDKLVGSNTAQIKIEFIDQNGAIVGSGQLGVADANSPTSYREGVLRATAPATAKFARAVLEMQQINSAGGSVDFDDASIKRWTASSVAGDVNLDGVRDARDLDALQHSLIAANTAFDFNHDSAVNAADVDALLSSAFTTSRGDANLDHSVDFNDLLALASDYGTIGTGTWSTGDFNGDSNVSFDDLLILAAHYSTSSGDSATLLNASTTVGADWALARSLVPEPASVLAVLTMAACAGGRYRRAAPVMARMGSLTHVTSNRVAEARVHP